MQCVAVQKMKFEEKSARQNQIELHLGQFVYEQEGSSDQWSFKEEDRRAVRLKHGIYNLAKVVQKTPGLYLGHGLNQ